VSLNALPKGAVASLQLYSRLRRSLLPIDFEDKPIPLRKAPRA